MKRSKKLTEVPDESLERLLSRRQLVAGAGAVGVGALLAACGGDDEEAAPAPTPEPTPAPTPAQPEPAPPPAPAAAAELIMATPGEAPTLFQNLEYQPQAYSIYDSILEFLLKADPLDPAKGPQPQLAESWRPVGDRQWEFTLRQGVTFHNGEAWNAEAAKVNLDLVLKIDPPSPVLFRIGPFESAEVKDEYTLLINTKTPWATAPIGMSEVQFGAPGYLTDVGPQEFAQSPIGTGPYKFSEWKKGQEIILEANGDYWGTPATIERLIFRGIPDQASRFAALQAGEIHIVEDLLLDDVESAQGAGLVVADTPIMQSVLLTPYMIDAKTDGHPTADPKVRLAMNHAIDRQAIIDSVLGGYGRLMNGQVTGADAFGWNSTLQDYPYDPQRAKDLLAEAGFANGVDLGTLWMGEPAEWLKQQDFVEVIRNQFSEVGITFEPKVVDESTFLRMALQEYSLKYWHVGGWQYHPVGDSGFALMWYDSEAFLRTGLGDPEFDKVWRASDAEVDLETRRGLLEQAHKIVHDTPGPVFLWQHHKLYALSPNVKGFVTTPDERVHWAGMTLEA